MYAILAAILWLAPGAGVTQATVYARTITRESARCGIDPLLVVAVAHLESGWEPTARSTTSDYGLLQVHVSTTTYPEYLGRERELLEPRLNLVLGIRLMRTWKAYHGRKCTGRRPHPWWSHLAWGRRVRTLDSGRRVMELYQVLHLRFGGVV